MPAKKQPSNKEKIRLQFLNLSARMQDIYIEHALLRHHRTDFNLDWRFVPYRVNCLMRSASLLLKEAENAYEQAKKEKASQNISQFGKYVMTLATDLNLDAFVLQRKKYVYLFN